MALRLKHLKFPSGIESTLRRAWTYDDDSAEAVNLINFDWELDEFFNMLSPVEVYVRCKGFGKIRLRELTIFFLEIDAEKTIAWLKQSPELLDKQPFRIRLKVEEQTNES
jgi:hypothetical protein